MDLSQIRLVATDLDGTFLRNDLSVSARTRAAVAALQRAGIPVVPVTARQPIGLRGIADEAGFGSWAVCSNGSLVIDLASGRRLLEATVTVEAQTALANALLEAVPEALFVSVRDGGEVFVAQEGYGDLADLADHKRDPSTMGASTLAEVLAEPSLKVVVRHPTMSAPELLEVVHRLGLPGFEATHSGAPFVEVMPEAVTKATGLTALCAELGVQQHQVLAFGDAPNDVALVSWAGLGVAVANADPLVREVADHVTGSNEADGVAEVLEDLLATRPSAP